VAVGGALVCLAVSGMAAAASPGRLSVADPAWWLVGGLAIGALAVLVTAAGVLVLRHPKASRPLREHRGGARVAPSLLLLVLVVIAALVWAGGQLGSSASPPRTLLRKPPPAANRLHSSQSASSTGFGPWLAIALGLLVLAGLAWVAVVQLRSRRAVAPAEILPGDPLAAAVEAALLDLEGELDARRAVIKAYARTEAVLREHGLPRRPSEAPLEYLDRVLRDLGARAGAVDRLTELFERAAFSQHPVGQEMRDEAVAVFHGLRDELSVEPAQP
jgi:hypothetical protein